LIRGALALVRNSLGERGSTPVVPVNVLTEVDSPVALHPGGLIIEYYRNAMIETDRVLTTRMDDGTHRINRAFRPACK